MSVIFPHRLLILYVNLGPLRLFSIDKKPAVVESVFLFYFVNKVEGGEGLFDRQDLTGNKWLLDTMLQTSHCYFLYLIFS